MSGNKKRQLQSYLEQKRERFDDLMRLSYHDRMRVMEQEWSQNFWLEDANPEKQARVEMETGADPSIQNAIFRVNTASQKPSTEQIDSFIREEKQRSKDRFLKLVETIDDLSAKIKEIEPQALSAFAASQQLQYFTDLRLGTYDARKDAELIRQHCEAEPEPAAETQTPPAETQTTESKPETESTKPGDVKPESATETQIQTETKSEAPAELKPEVKSETPAETKPETQTPIEIKPTEANLETTPENKSAVKNETPTEVKTTEPKPETQTAPEVKPEIKPEAAAGPVSVNA